MTRHQSATARKLALIADDIVRASADPDGVLQRMHDALEGHPAAQSYDPGGGGDGTSSTERIGIRLQEHGDRARSDRALMDRLVGRMVDDARQLATLAATYSPRPASDKAKREAERANSASDECAHCTEHRKAGNANPIHRTGDVSGNLPAPLALCEWCYRRTRTLGRLPSPSEVERNDLGLRVYDRA